MKLRTMGQTQTSQFCPPKKRMSTEQLELWLKVTSRTVSSDNLVLKQRSAICKQIAAMIIDVNTVRGFLSSLYPVREILSNLPMHPAKCPEGLTPETLPVQAAKDLCRESLIINNEEFHKHCDSDCTRGASILKQKMLLEVFKDKFEDYKARFPFCTSLEQFHDIKKNCVNRIFQAACRTISGGDSYDEIVALFASPNVIITPFVVQPLRELYLIDHCFRLTV